jgi:hypothetical protein
MTAEQLANEFLRDWILLPPPGCVVRVNQPAESPPEMEMRVDEIEIEVDLSFTLWEVNERGDGKYFAPENIIEFISIPEDWSHDIGRWWRQIRE